MENAVSRQVHLEYLRKTIELAKKSPPKPTNFRVGCVIVSSGKGGAADSHQRRTLSTGYTLELPGNTHAEQCAFSKLQSNHNLTTEADLGAVLTPDTNAVLYTSLEPCSLRLSGNAPCVQRIIATRSQNPEAGIRHVVFGAKEPGTFVQDSKSCQLLTEAGVSWEYITDFESEILEVAMEGHHRVHDMDPEEEDGLDAEVKRRVKEMSVEAADQLEAQKDKEQATVKGCSNGDERASRPRNPKKRMMDVVPGSEESWK